MSQLVINIDPRVEEKFSRYPKAIRPKMEALRQLIFEVAEESETTLELEETLKWGEPSYLTKKGSTIRMDWKAKSPEQYAMYFKCTSKLVLSFKEIFGDKFNYEKNRAILFKLTDKVPKKELKICIELALNYHLYKKLPLLGYDNK